MSKLSAYTEATAGNSGDYLYIVQGGVTKKVQIGNLTGPYANAITFSGGIKLGADTDLLDRHVLGTFTPVVKGTVTAGGPHTYAAQVGRYVRIGKMVYVNIYVALSSLGAAMAGDAIIDGLPFASENVASSYHCMAWGGGKVDFSAGFTQITARVNPNTSYVAMQQLGDNVDGIGLPVAGVLATTSMVISGWYRAA